MRVPNEILKTIATMSPEGLHSTVVLGGFALAAFAIYAVMRIAKERQK